MKPILDWFKSKNWKPLPFQTEAWKAIADGQSGLISVPTGAGKTYAAFLGALFDVKPKNGLQLLYITPLRALARDLEQALKCPIEDLHLPLRVEMRTGDTSSSMRQKQAKNPPEILLTTPESLSLMLTDVMSQVKFRDLKYIIVDEWHELLGTKRGVLLELALARLKQWNSEIRIWGLTATLGNIHEAAQVIVGQNRNPTIIAEEIPRDVIVRTLLPESVEGLPWAGHFGLRMLPLVLKTLNPDYTTLIFTNTRAQAERWHHAIIESKPEWKAITALHHSSIDRKLREKIEKDTKEGILKFVVCTSSLDLGVDFSKVEEVIQIGSPKSIARLIQRAGRSSHRPFTPCNLTIVPTHALEIAELNGYRMALLDHIIETRTPLQNCYDVLLQHITSCAIGGGFDEQEMFAEIKTTHAFKDLSTDAYQEALNFLTTGGRALSAYPEYKKLHKEGTRYNLQDKKIISRHRLNIGTITSDAHVPVKTLRGKSIGSVEENFIASLQPGQAFIFGGKVLELVQYRDLTAYVRSSRQKSPTSAVWQGSRLPFSAPLGHYLRRAVDHNAPSFPESELLNAIFKIQTKLSYVPKENELLVEILKTREGRHLLLYPFEGKIIHQGLAYLLAHRLSQSIPRTFTLSSNDYGLELLCHDQIDESEITAALFDHTDLKNEITHVQNLHELGRGFFRDIARIAGLVFQGFPGRHKTNRQIQASSGLIYEVFSKYDPNNLLYLQSKEEIMVKYFELNRLQDVLKRLHESTLVIKTLNRFSPFSLPLYIERTSGHLSTEDLAARIEKIKLQWTKR